MITIGIERGTPPSTCDLLIKRLMARFAGSFSSSDEWICTIRIVFGSPTSITPHEFEGIRIIDSDFHDKSVTIVAIIPKSSHNWTSCEALDYCRTSIEQMISMGVARLNAMWKLGVSVEDFRAFAEEHLKAEEPVSDGCL